MITIANQCPVFVVTATNAPELGLTNSGVWQVRSVVELSAGTNAGVEFNGLRDGAVILVDAAGEVHLAGNGPELMLASVYGFSVGITVVGLVYVLRWVAHAFLGGAKIPISAAE